MSNLDEVKRIARSVGATFKVEYESSGETMFEIPQSLMLRLYEALDERIENKERGHKDLYKLRSDLTNYTCD